MLPTKASILSTSRVSSVYRALACKHRHIVSAAYSLQSEWNVRLDTPALKTIDAKQLVLTMHLQTQALTPIAAIDMDILANRLANLDLTLLPTFETVLGSFRNSQNCLRALPSTSHAIVRGLLELGELRRLVGLLSNKDDFGLFLDAHAACIAIRHALIDSNDLESAARIACDFLLQEHGHRSACTSQSEANRGSYEADAFANCVAFGALHRFIVARIETDGDAKILSITKQTDASANDATNDIVEWVRVDAVRNPPAFSWLTLFKNDDPPTTIGYALRCFVNALRNSKQINDKQSSDVYHVTSPAAQAVADNYELIALALLRRVDEAKELVSKLDASRLCSETLRFCQAAGIKFADTAGNSSSTSLKQVGETFVAEVVQRCEAAQLERARQAYAAWNARRSDELAAHARRFATERRRAELKAQLTSLLETEELLTFFTKQREIELQAWLAPRSRAERKRRTREQYEEELRNVLKEKARIKSYLEALPTD